MSKRGYSEEFRREAVELSKKIGMQKSADELGVHVSTISSWKKELTTETSSSSTNKTSSELEKENKRLEKENYYLKEINKVLKKSVAIISSDQMKNLK